MVAHGYDLDVFRARGIAEGEWGSCTTPPRGQWCFRLVCACGRIVAEHRFVSNSGCDYTCSGCGVEVRLIIQQLPPRGSSHCFEAAAFLLSADGVTEGERLWVCMATVEPNPFPYMGAWMEPEVHRIAGP